VRSLSLVGAGASWGRCRTALKSRNWAVRPHLLHLKIRIECSATTASRTSCSDDGSELLTRSIRWLTPSTYRTCQVFPLRPAPKVRKILFKSVIGFSDRSALPPGLESASALFGVEAGLLSLSSKGFAQEKSDLGEQAAAQNRDHPYHKPSIHVHTSRNRRVRYRRNAADGRWAGW
jgi:hypothetical protein